jgi:Family of unknown function (DUF6223)
MNQLFTSSVTGPRASILLQAVEPLVLTTDRLVANIGVVLAIAAVLLGVLALRRSASHTPPGNGRRGAIASFVAGLVAAIIGGLLLMTADGGPGSGNGVVGAALALVLGVVAMITGGLAITRARRTA